MNVSRGNIPKWATTSRSSGWIAQASSSAVAGCMTEWLRRNVREEDFVLMKAEVEAVEEILKGRAIALVDELFLECGNQWQKGRSNQNRRAYWECLALCGNLRDDGVAAHLWRDTDFLN
ncbi:hypothetical protein HPP92_015832 [Vanilla planifolia]|uniref:DUF7870 domain-containing protein n=1 Tax=Vanilla planifolia TaxID=51239 RepID=A0A835U4Z8_VANPL|nr:hypothetical protein HPP92_027231 [Vanilla planifolia]KAG0471286.1 hypothetical protein HPP92_015832 [Vanilla planifolia]